MRVLVVGGDGFIGSHVVDQLVELKHETTVFDKCPYQMTKNLEHLKSKIRVVSGEFANKTDLRDVLQGQDVVYHFVWASTPIASWKDPYIEIDENIRLSVQLIEIAAEMGVKKIVFPSSGGTVYGAHKEGDRVTESCLPQPSCPYGIGKLAVEYFLNHFRNIYGIASDVYRIGNAYGSRQPLQSQQGVVAVWMAKILAGEKIKIYGNQETLRDYVYVTDIAYLVTHSLSSLAKSEVLNIGTGKGTSILELLNIFKKVIDKQFEFEIQPRRSSDVASIVLDSRKILAYFPGFCFSALDDKIRETWQILRKK
jgi:UDP-glucose 4-epimerase